MDRVKLLNCSLENICTDEVLDALRFAYASMYEGFRACVFICVSMNDAVLVCFCVSVLTYVCVRKIV